jgi:hypothetical protein
MSIQPGAPGASKAPRFGLMLALLALLAFATREYIVLATDVFVPVRGDIREYVAYALNLVQHGVYSSTFPPHPPVPDAYRGPGYPWLIALAMEVFPQDPTTKQIGPWYPLLLQMQVVLGTASVVMATLLARHWLSASASIFAGLLFALWPHHVAATSSMLSEVLFGFALLAGLLSLARGWTTKRLPWFAIAGLAWGFAFLVNPVALLFPPCIAALLWLHRRPRPAAVLLAVFLVPVALLLVRNAQLDNDSGGSRERAEANFVQGSWPNYHPAANRFRDGDPVAIAIMEEIDAETQELHRDPKAGIARIAKRMSSDPRFHATWYLRKPWVLWGWKIRLGASDIQYDETRYAPFERNAAMRAIASTYRAINPLLTTITLAMAVVLTWLGLRNATLLPAAATGALVLYVTLVHEILQAEPRYATAYRGLESVLVVTALAWGWKWLQKKQNKALNSSGASMAVRD